MSLATTKNKIILIAVVVIAVGSILTYQRVKISKLEKNVVVLTANNSKLEDTVTEQKETITSLEAGLDNIIDSSNTLAEKIAKLEEQKQIIIQRLNDYRGKLKNEALEKPTATEHNINSYVANLLHKFDKATKG